MKIRREREPGSIRIEITEDPRKDLFRIEIEDNGRGMSKKTLARVLDPFYTTKTVRRVGLGLPMLYQATQQTGGRFEIKSEQEARNACSCRVQIWSSRSATARGHSGYDCNAGGGEFRPGFYLHPPQRGPDFFSGHKRTQKRDRRYSCRPSRDTAIHPDQHQEGIGGDRS